MDSRGGWRRVVRQVLEEHVLAKGIRILVLIFCDSCIIESRSAAGATCP